MTKDKTNIEEIKKAVVECVLRTTDGYTRLEESNYFNKEFYIVEEAINKYYVSKRDIGYRVDNYSTTVVGLLEPKDVLKSLKRYLLSSYSRSGDDNYCMCGGTKLPESDFCKECI